MRCEYFIRLPAWFCTEYSDKLCVVYDDLKPASLYQMKSLGQFLFDVVINKLQLLEADYFDLEYTDSDQMPCWLDRSKPINKQVSCSQNEPSFRFLVKFYTPDPGLLEEELTRYLFAMQIKEDLANGLLFCQEHTAVLLASYVVQAEVGNYCEELEDQDYLRTLKILPNQTRELELKIMEHHKEHFNQSPGDADFNLLDTVRKVEFYGIHMHPAKDHEGIALHLAVAHFGIIVFHNYTKINAFSWAKIRKLCFKRKKFTIKLHPDHYAYNKEMVEFYFPSRNWAKNFWKRCIEHHAFFRCHTVKHVERSRSRVVSRGSSFRYSGKTQKELVEYMRETYIRPTTFERSSSMRTMSALNSRAGTPRTGTLNLRDLRQQHASFSSGSRTLERYGQANSFDNSVHVLERDNNTHEPNSPRNQSSFRTFHSQRNGTGYTPTAPHYVSMSSNALSGNNTTGRVALVDKIDTSVFMLSKNAHKMSSPAVFAASHTSSNDTATDEHHFTYHQRLPDRSEHLQSIGSINSAGKYPPTVHPVHIDGSRIMSYGNNNIPRKDSTATNDSLPSPPPPPPPTYDDLGFPPSRPPLVRSDRHHDDSIFTRTSKSTTSGASVTLTSNASFMSSQTDESEDDAQRRQRFSNDRTYYIVKELLMTERTYKKDLELITQNLRDAMANDDAMPIYLTRLIFEPLTPIYEFHCGLLRELEKRLAIWEGRSSLQRSYEFKRVGDLLVNMPVLHSYGSYLERLEEMLLKLDVAMKRNKNLEQIIIEFESLKICYLPLNAFLMKPIQRLLHLQLILEKLLAGYNSDHPDITDCKVCLEQLVQITQPYEESWKLLVNWQKLVDVQKDLTGISNLVQPNRLFIREGCLQKLSRKGYQQRMFILFSDVLIYTNRSTTPSLQFKVHGQLMLRGMSVEEANLRLGETAPEFSFAVYSSNRCLVVSASCQEEKNKWMDDLQRAIQLRDMSTEQDDNAKLLYASLKSASSSEALDDSCDESLSPEHTIQIQQRANTVTHVCWHRNTSIGVKDHHVALRNQLSGYLLRKFKNSNGWQKLWVVFTNFCLFFFKGYHDECPLASLPLLGYSISTPSPADGIHKDFVFKLQFKNHVYYFRAESDVTFDRWIEVLGTVMCALKINKSFSRTDSDLSQLPPPPLPSRHQF